MKTRMAEWMTFYDVNPKDIYKKTGISITRVHECLSGKVLTLKEAISVCNVLGITVDELIYVHPLEQYPFYTQKFTTSSFREMLRLRNYFKVKYPNTTWSIQIYADWSENYRYEFSYCRRFPLTIRQLHRIVTSKKYRDPEERAIPVEVFAKYRLLINKKTTIMK